MNNFKNIKRMIIALVVIIIFIAVMIISVLKVGLRTNNDILVCTLSILIAFTKVIDIIVIIVSELKFRRTMTAVDPEFEGATDIKISLDGKSVSFTKDIDQSDIPEDLLKL